eukprot:5184152-Prymnesium_polylepis.1
MPAMARTGGTHSTNGPCVHVCSCACVLSCMGALEHALPRACQTLRDDVSPPLDAPAGVTRPCMCWPFPLICASDAAGRLEIA